MVKVKLVIDYCCGELKDMVQDHFIAFELSNDKTKINFFVCSQRFVANYYLKYCPRCGERL